MALSLIQQTLFWTAAEMHTTERQLAHLNTAPLSPRLQQEAQASTSMALTQPFRFLTPLSLSLPTRFQWSSGC